MSTHILSTVGFAAAVGIGSNALSGAAQMALPEWAGAGGIKQIAIEWGAPAVAVAVVAPMITRQASSALFAGGLAVAAIGARRLLAAYVPQAAGAGPMGYALRYGVPALVVGALGAAYHAI